MSSLDSVTVQVPWASPLSPCQLTQPCMLMDPGGAAWPVQGRSAETQTQVAPHRSSEESSLLLCRDIVTALQHTYSRCTNQTCARSECHQVGPPTDPLPHREPERGRYRLPLRLECWAGCARHRTF